MGLVCGGL